MNLQTTTEDDPNNCNHCRKAGHSAKDCRFGSTPDERFIRCPRGTVVADGVCSAANPSAAAGAVGGNLPCFPRRFLVLLRRAKPDFDVSNLREGRVDVGVSSTAAALFRSQSARHNAATTLVFAEGNRTVDIFGSMVRERDLLQLLLFALNFCCWP